MAGREVALPLASVRARAVLRGLLPLQEFVRVRGIEACGADGDSSVVGAASGCGTGSRTLGSLPTALVSDRLSLGAGQ